MATLLGKKALIQHRIECHGAKLRPLRGPVRQPQGAKPLDAIYELERQIRDKVRELETERDQLQARILEIDNMCAKWKKL